MNFEHNRLYKALLIALMVALLFGVSKTQRQLNRDRERLGLTRLTPLENAPPVLAFTTVALGGFRGLIANLLWIRANDLQEQDKYFEMVQLADWITKLEPHYVHVWTMQAWNMAYNISIKFKDFPDRWRWVKAGIELLRDEGLKYNPDETLIYRELAWFFQHKMGQNMDDAHAYFKNQWYEEMSAVFHSRPDYNELLNPQTEDARARVKLLREKFKMDPQVMKAVDDHYGPLEWRLPEASAIYWAWLGLKKAKREELITLRRVIYQSMQLAFQRGAITEDPLQPGNFVLGPNLDLIPHTNQAYEDMMAMDAEMREHIQTGHKNFLLNVPYTLYLYNRKTEANYWFKYLKQKYPDAIAGYLKLKGLGATSDMTLDEYTVIRTTEDAGETNHDKLTAVISGLLSNSYVELIADAEDRYENYQNLAARVWARYQREMEHIGPGTIKRIGLAPLPTLKQNVINILLDPERGVKPELAARLRTKLGLPAPTNAAPAQPKP